MKKFITVAGLGLGLLLLVNPNNSSAEESIINYETDGRVTPLKDASTLTEEQLNSVLTAIGIDERAIENMAFRK